MLYPFVRRVIILIRQIIAQFRLYISCVGKVMERVVYKHVYNHLQSLKLIYEFQFGLMYVTPFIIMFVHFISKTGGRVIANNSLLSFIQITMKPIKQISIDSIRQWDTTFHVCIENVCTNNVFVCAVV
jgi:hypothetical protein